MLDYLIRGSAAGGGIRFFCCTTKNLVEKARTIHDCSPVSIAALGRMLTAGCMMGNMLKSEEDRMTLQINGNGPAGPIVVTASPEGMVKGYIHNAKVEHYLKESGKLDVGRAVGTDGNLTVIMDLGLKEPYVGQIPITNGEIAEDITAYYAISEQVPSSVALGVLVERDFTVRAAGGFIVQLMPEAQEETVAALENNLKKLPAITTMLDEGKSCEEIMDLVLDGMTIVLYEKKELDFVCDCGRERIERVLISLGEEELTKLIEEEEAAEVVCQFCNQKYQFSKEDLSSLLSQAKEREDITAE